MKGYNKALFQLIGPFLLTLNVSAMMQQQVVEQPKQQEESQRMKDLRKQAQEKARVRKEALEQDQEQSKQGQLKSLNASISQSNTKWKLSDEYQQFELSKLSTDKEIKQAKDVQTRLAELDEIIARDKSRLMGQRTTYKQEQDYLQAVYERRKLIKEENKRKEKEILANRAFWRDARNREELKRQVAEELIRQGAKGEYMEAYARVLSDKWLQEGHISQKDINKIQHVKAGKANMELMAQRIAKELLEQNKEEYRDFINRYEWFTKLKYYKTEEGEKYYDKHPNELPFFDYTSVMKAHPSLQVNTFDHLDDVNGFMAELAYDKATSFQKTMSKLGRFGDLVNKAITGKHESWARQGIQMQSFKDYLQSLLKKIVVATLIGTVAKLAWDVGAKALIKQTIKEVATSQVLSTLAFYFTPLLVGYLVHTRFLADAGIDPKSPEGWGLTLLSILLILFVEVVVIKQTAPEKWEKVKDATKRATEALGLALVLSAPVVAFVMTYMFIHRNVSLTLKMAELIYPDTPIHQLEIGAYINELDTALSVLVASILGGVLALLFYPPVFNYLDEYKEQARLEETTPGDQAIDWMVDKADKAYEAMEQLYDWWKIPQTTASTFGF